MQFALPPRKTSQPPPYARVSRNPPRYRGREMKILGYAVCGFLAAYLLLHHFFFSSTTKDDLVPAGTPPVVIVTVFDEGHMSEDYIQKIKNNRQDYAFRHGYANFFTNVSNYTQYTQPAPTSWTLVPALRHALTLYPHTEFLFSLSPYALIMTPSLSLHDHILEPARLESLMRKDIPVVPPDSVIRTFSHPKGANIDLVMTQDAENIGHGSFILRSGEWAKFLLDTWFNPLYRAYNFQKAEGHALEHIVQWHPTVLAKLALVPQRVMNSYNFDIRIVDPKKANKEPAPSCVFEKGDLLVHLHGCGKSPERDCDREMQNYYAKWEETRAIDGPKPSS